MIEEKQNTTKEITQQNLVNFLTCPECGKHVGTDWDAYPANITCPNCTKQFNNKNFFPSYIVYKKI